MSTVMAVRKSGGYSDEHGEVSGISINCANNGFTLEIRHKVKPTKANMMQTWDSDPDVKVFNDVEAMLDEIRRAVGRKKPAKK